MKVRSTIKSTKHPRTGAKFLSPFGPKMKFGSGLNVNGKGGLKVSR